MPRAPSSDSAERTRGALVLPRGDYHVGRLAASRRSVGGARAPARADDVERHLARGAHELARRRQARLRSRKPRARAGARRPTRRGREQRVVRERGADAHGHGVHLRRQRCDIARLCSPEIHCESPVEVATLPSSVIADLNSTCGRPVLANLRNGWLSSRAACAGAPAATSTRMPSSRRMRGRGRGRARSGRPTPPPRARCGPPRSPPCQGGVLPVWQHGSSDTYIVAPAGSSVQAASASRSAWGKTGPPRASPRRSRGPPSPPPRLPAGWGLCGLEPAQRARSCA